MTLAELEQRRAARLDPNDLPHTTTIRDARDYAAETASLDHRLVSAKSAMATLAELVVAADADTKWLADLATWRELLGKELFTIKAPIRDPKEKGRNDNLTLSIKVIDGRTDLAGSAYDLINLRLGELMRASGYEPIGADPARNYVGRMPWHGSTKETEQRIRATESRRAKAQAALDSALLDDEVRETREAEAKVLRDAYNALDVRVGPDGRSLVVWGIDDESTLTPRQREALANARAAFR